MSKYDNLGKGLGQIAPEEWDLSWKTVPATSVYSIVKENVFKILF